MKDFFTNLFNSMDAIYILLRMGLFSFITILISRIYKKLIPTDGRFQSKLHQRFLRNFVSNVIYIIGFMVVVYQVPVLDKAIQTILATSGVLAIVVGLAAQKSLGNAIDGFFISLFHPFEIGDRITLTTKGLTGYVEDMSLRQTVLRTYSNDRIIIPNSVLSQEILENSNFQDRRIASFIDITVAYGTNIDTASKIMADVIVKHPDYATLDTEENKIEKKGPPTVYLRSFSADGAMLRASMWCRNIDRSFDACSEIRFEIYREFEKAEITIIGS